MYVFQHDSGVTIIILHTQTHTHKHTHTHTHTHTQSFCGVYVFVLSVVSNVPDVYVLSILDCSFRFL